MNPRWQGIIARLVAGAAVGVAVGFLYDRNTRAFVLPPNAGIDWGAVLAAAVTLGSLLITYEVLAWLLRLGIRRLMRRSRRISHPPGGAGPPSGEGAQQER
jgi:hypothetical protein